jgi:hypothetical protein
VIGHSVESVTPELVISHQDQEKIELDSTFNVYNLVLAFPHLKKKRPVLVRFQNYGGRVHSKEQDWLRPVSRLLQDSFLFVLLMIN